MDPHELLQIAARATIVYFLTLLAVRLLGKREIGNFTAFDLIVSLIIGESVDEAIYGDVTMVKFIVLLATIVIWHLANSWASYKSKLVDRITGAEPTVLVEHGHIQQDALAHERMSEDELWSELRLQGVDDLSEISCATLEPGGKVSVLLEEWAKPLQKGDIAGLVKKKDAAED